MPSVRQHTHGEGFITGAKYTFRVIAINYNGQSVPSDEYWFNACMAPDLMSQPFRIDEGSFQDNLVIGWSQPVDNGGCPITGYAIYRDDADTGDVTTQVNLEIASNPVLRQVTITDFEANTGGMLYRVMVRAYNREGYTDSAFLTIMNAGHP